MTFTPWTRRGVLTLMLIANFAVACGGGSTESSEPTAGSGRTGTEPTSPAQTTSTSPSQEPTESPAGELAGTWDGTWESTSHPGTSGTIRILFTQSGSQLSGTITVSNTPCVTEGTISGNVDGDAITFGAVQAEHEFTFDGAIEGTTMSGTYSGPTCDGAAGQWEATKTT